MKLKSVFFYVVVKMAGSSEITRQGRRYCAEKPEKKKSNGIASKPGNIRISGNQSKLMRIKKSEKQNCSQTGNQKGGPEY
jgi:hypothetical protein